VGLPLAAVRADPEDIGGGAAGHRRGGRVWWSGAGGRASAARTRCPVRGREAGAPGGVELNSTPGSAAHRVAVQLDQCSPVAGSPSSGAGENHAARHDLYTSTRQCYVRFLPTGLDGAPGRPGRPGPAPGPRARAVCFRRHLAGIFQNSPGAYWRLCGMGV
jgi:hypothetical protein